MVEDLDGLSISNETAFNSDPNYTFVENTFTMKKVDLYINCADKFVFSGQTGPDGVTFLTNYEINPLQKNFTSSFNDITSIFNTFVGEYNSGNTNGSCSLLDAYILEANGQTGPDGVTFNTDNRFAPTSVLDHLTLENENERYIYAANRSAIPKIIDDIERQLNG